MARIHNLGFPRIGNKRQLKTATEKYWSGAVEPHELEDTARDLRRVHWHLQAEAELDFVPVGDFSLYDHMLDLSLALGNVPERFAGEAHLGETDVAFRVARGVTPAHGENVAAAEMTKWFDTNYHYIVPEFTARTRFSPHPARLVAQIEEATALGMPVKVVLPGPMTYLYLGKVKDAELDPLSFLPDLLSAYASLLKSLVEAVDSHPRAIGDRVWVQIDEPILALDLPAEWREAFHTAYSALETVPAQILLAVYFGALRENLDFVLDLPVDGLHVDAVRGGDDVSRLIEQWPQEKVLSLGVIDGRNVWKSDLEKILEKLEPIHRTRGDTLWVAPSCSLIHVPVDLDTESGLDPEVREWLSFAVQKLGELSLLRRALDEGREAVGRELDERRAAIERRARSGRTFDAAVRERVSGIRREMLRRSTPFAERSRRQRERLRLPLFPTTTIGSFPQTREIRAARRRYKSGRSTEAEYKRLIQDQIDYAIAEQESYGLDVLVHGEAERNDMVEYFGEQLSGYAFTANGWVQSYGTRCVKPPIIYGDVSRPKPMTVEWSSYAQSRSTRPMKGMLTGPITMMQWAFVRDDQPRHETARQIALALRDEVGDLEAAGIGIIQVDEAALREALPLRRADWDEWLRAATDNFKLATSGVGDRTQIHTHMCYSEFNDIVASIVDLDADVITIEAARSDMDLLDAFESFDYPNEIGPGVYDIHSPNVPTVEFIVGRMRMALERIPAERLWVNPDCGLKTRAWSEVAPSLRNLVEAARILRAERE